MYIYSTIHKCKPHLTNTTNLKTILQNFKYAHLHKPEIWLTHTNKIVGRVDCKQKDYQHRYTTKHLYITHTSTIAKDVPNLFVDYVITFKIITNTLTTYVTTTTTSTIVVIVVVVLLQLQLLFSKDLPATSTQSHKYATASPQQ